MKFEFYAKKRDDVLQLDFEVDEDSEGREVIEIVHRHGEDAYCPLFIITADGKLGLINVISNGDYGLQTDREGFIKVVRLETDARGKYKEIKITNKKEK